PGPSPAAAAAEPAAQPVVSQPGPPPALARQATEPIAEPPRAIAQSAAPERSPVLSSPPVRPITRQAAPAAQSQDLSPSPAAAAQPLPTPSITDISANLPRGNKPWEERPLSQARRLIINHTGAPPLVPVKVIAQAHVDRGYPGIAYDFYVSQSGQIFQVSPLEAVVKADAEWSGGGVNICLEGNFDAAPPPPAQLSAAVHLAAWMLQRLGLLPDAIVGLQEVIQTTSPGRTFLAGPTWKTGLVNEVRHLLEKAGPPAAGAMAASSSAPTAAPAFPPRQQQINPILAPPIQDIVAQLPRDPAGFFSRSAEDIQHLVINHTAAPPDVTADVIANAFREKLPGILYQYFITAEGQILQTQPLMQVVDGERPYIANAINIAFAGDFSTDIPSNRQIQAGGHLIAWLMGEFPQLSLASVRGVSEFIPHGSPGEQWLRGRRWKDMLLNTIADRLRDESTAGPAGDNPALQRQIRELQQQNETLLVQAGQVRRENGRLSAEIQELRADPNRWQRVPPPVIHDISGQLPRHPSLRYEQRRLESINHLAVHHTAMPSHVGPERIAAIHVEADPERGKEAWPGIGYHFFVHADGRIDQTQPLENLVYHVAGHNQQTVGIVFAGSFMNGNVPTQPQLQAGGRLVAWLLQELKLPLQHVWGHKEFAGNRTTCPGSEWSDGRKWRDSLFEEVVRVQSGGDKRPIHHYLLVGATELAAAQPYIEHFRPAVGFAVEEALYAKFVTIVGSTAGISVQDEDRLRRAGVQVERIGGENGAETARQLEALVERGERFQELVEN
ncbi:MAG: N-acetylmuramoyl-L-alanine amidase, partial [Caldilineaceae bacterium]